MCAACCVMVVWPWVRPVSSAPTKCSMLHAPCCISSVTAVADCSGSPSTAWAAVRFAKVARAVPSFSTTKRLEHWNHNVASRESTYTSK